MLLKSKVAVITGAASLRGIGKATARVFAAQGASIVILDLDLAAAQAAAADIGAQHLGLKCDVTKKSECDQRRSGSIVCLSSVSAQRGGGIFGGPHYSAAKGGVLGLAKAMARELGPDNIRVNCITPGLIETDITGGMMTDALRVEILKGIPLNRLGQASDVANAALYLAADLSSYLTGIALDVNGGMLIHG